MGMYDTYGQCQLKVGECLGTHYQMGDKVDIADGVYLCNEGAIVIKDGIFIVEYEKINSKWGHELDTSELIEKLNPIFQIVENQKNNHNE